MASRPMLAVRAVKITHGTMFIPAARARGTMKNSAVPVANSRSHHTCTPHRLVVWLVQTSTTPSLKMVIAV